MNRLFSLVLLGLGLGLGTVAAAQGDDPMELQRCIWRCLAASPGNTSPQYHACVRQYCSAPQAQGAVGASWTSGIAADGLTRYAGAQLADGSRRGLYFMCQPGQGYLMLYALDGPPGTYGLRIDGQSYALAFHRARQQLTVDLLPGAQFLNVLASGRWVEVVDPYGTVALSVDLGGAAGHIAATRQACGT